MKNIFLGLLLGFSSMANAADLNITPSSLKLKVYKFAVSKSKLCTDLVTVIDNGDDPSEVDFADVPNLGSGTLSNGTYPCIVIEFSDNIKFTPSVSSDSGSCSASVEETMDVCSGQNGETSALVDGTTTTCTAGENIVSMYISTGASSTTNSDAFNPPDEDGDADHGFNLAEALVVSGDSAGKFVVDASEKVCDGDDNTCDGGGNTGECRMAPPTFTFSQE